MSRKIIRYRSGRARRLVNQAKIALVVAGFSAGFTVAALAGTNFQVTSFHWIMMGVTATFAALSLLLQHLAARAGLDPATGEPDLVVIQQMTVPSRAVVQAAVRAAAYEPPRPVIPKPPAVAAQPAPVYAAPVVAAPVPAPAQPVPAEPVRTTKTPTSAVHQDAELAVQP